MTRGKKQERLARDDDRCRGPLRHALRRVNPDVGAARAHAVAPALPDVDRLRDHPGDEKPVADLRRRRKPRGVAAEVRAQPGTGPAVRGCVPTRSGADDVERVVGAHEPGDERTRRPHEDLLGRAELLDAARIDDRDPVGERQRLLAIVRDVDGSDADALLQRAELVAEFEPDLVVEVRHRLVEQQKRRVDGERAAQRDALPLPARQLRHRSRPETLELEQLEHLGDARRDRVLLPAAHHESVADVGGDRHVRPQRIRLEHHRRVALLGRQRRDVAAVDADRA